MRLQDKVAVVTGAGRGIGQAIAARFAAEGARVVVADVAADLGEATARAIGDRATAISVDVTKAPAVDALFEQVSRELGRLDILVCNAGRPYRSSSLAASEHEWSECLDVNLKSVWLCARAAHPALRHGRGGSIVTIASAQGHRSNRRSFPYSAAKGGLLALTRSLAVEYAADGIRVNAIIPGQIESVRTEPYFQSFRDPEEARRRVLSTFPLGRLGRPDDIAKAALFLASDDSEWITGTWLTVDGGRDAALVDLSDLETDAE